MESLNGQTQSLSLSQTSKTTLSKNPNDGFRDHIGELLSSVTGVEASKISSSLAWTNTLDKGDLLLAIPKLQLGKGVDPKQKAEEWSKAVSAA